MVIVWLIALSFGWQLQGGYHQTVQVTEHTSKVQPALTVNSYQGNSEDTDGLQPALGYNALNQPFSGTLTVASDN